MIAVSKVSPNTPRTTKLITWQTSFRHVGRQLTHLCVRPHSFWRPFRHFSVYTFDVHQYQPRSYRQEIADAKGRTGEQVVVPMFNLDQMLRV